MLDVVCVYYNTLIHPGTLMHCGNLCIKLLVIADHCSLNFDWHNDLRLLSFSYTLHVGLNHRRWGQWEHVLARAPLREKNQENFSGNYRIKFGNFSGKYHVKFVNFVNVSYIIFEQKCVAPSPKLTEPLRLRA